MMHVMSLLFGLAVFGLSGVASADHEPAEPTPCVSPTMVHNSTAVQFTGSSFGFHLPDQGIHAVARDSQTRDFVILRGQYFDGGTFTNFAPSIYKGTSSQGILTIDTNPGSPFAPIEMSSGYTILDSSHKNSGAFDQENDKFYFLAFVGGSTYLAMVDIVQWTLTTTLMATIHPAPLGLEYNGQTKEMWMLATDDSAIFVVNITDPTMPGMLIEVAGLASAAGSGEYRTALDSSTNLMYITGRERIEGSHNLGVTRYLATFDLSTKTEVSTVTIAEWQDYLSIAALDFDSSTGRLFVSAYENLQGNFDLYSIDVQTGAIEYSMKALKPVSITNWATTLEDGLLFSFFEDQKIHAAALQLFGVDCCAETAISCVENYARNYGCMVTSIPFSDLFAPDCAKAMFTGQLCLENHCEAENCLCTTPDNCSPNCASQNLPTWPADGCNRNDVGNAICDPMCLTHNALFDGGDCLQWELARGPVASELQSLDTDSDGAVDWTELSNSFYPSVTEEDFMRADIVADGKLSLTELMLLKVADRVSLGSFVTLEVNALQAMHHMALIIFALVDSNYDSVLQGSEIEGMYGLTESEVPAGVRDIDSGEITPVSLTAFFGEMVEGMWGDGNPALAEEAAGFVFMLVDLNQDGVLSRVETSVLGFSSDVFERIGGNQPYITKTTLVSAVGTSAEFGCSMKWRQVKTLRGELRFSAPILRRSEDSTCTFLVMPDWMYPKAIEDGSRTQWTAGASSSPRFVVRISEMGRGECFGVMISHTEVLTAASCFPYGFDQNLFDVAPLDGFGPPVGIDDIAFHPGYRMVAEGFHEYNVAVVRLVMSMQEIETARMHAGEDLIIDQEDACFERKLIVAETQRTPVSVVGIEDCAAAFRQGVGYDVVKSNDICTDSTKPINVTAGTPLLDRDGLLVGLASHAGEDSLQIFTKVSEVRQWILSVRELGMHPGRRLTIEIVSTEGPAVMLYPGSLPPSNSSALREVEYCDANTPEAIITDKGRGSITIEAKYGMAGTGSMNFTALIVAEKCTECEHCEIKPVDLKYLNELKSNGDAFQGGFTGAERQKDSWVCLRDWDVEDQVKCGVSPGEFACFRLSLPTNRWSWLGLNSDVKIVKES